MKEKNAKFWVAVALILCLISTLFSFAIQGNWGKVTVSELRLLDSAGYEVSTQLYKPETATAENPAPCIITIEGWYNNKEMQDLYSVEYARRGYVVMAVDMHGHGDSENTDANGLYTAAVGVDAAVEAVGILPYVDKTKIALTGHSSGGAACDMAVAIDNERETSLISAVLFQASTWCDDTGVDHSADLDGRYVGIIADLYDEFFFWTSDAEGNEIVPRDFLVSDDAKNFVNFNNGAEGMDTVVAGQYYEQDGLFRVIYQPDCTHPWVHFSPTCVAYGISFFEDAFGAPNPIAANNQVWTWKAFFNLIGLIGIVIFNLAFMVMMLDTKYFGVLKADTEPKPAIVKDSAGKAWFWGTLVVAAVFSYVSYLFAIANVYSKTTKFFTQTGPLTMGVWCVLCGVFAILVMTVYYFAYGKKAGFSAADAGIKINGQKLWRTIVLALLTVGLAMLILFFADFFFKTDFRFWVLTLKAFGPDKVVIALKYAPLFLLFYIVNSVSVNCFNFNNIGGKLNSLVLGLFNALGALFYVAIQYITFFNTGALKWYATEGERISGIWLYPAIVFLFFTPMFTRYIYKKTKNPYLCAIINALIITIMCVANTTTVLGGGAVVAANY